MTASGAAAAGTAIATGGSGAAQATAQTSGGLLAGLAAAANSTVNGQGYAYAGAQIGPTFAGFTPRDAYAVVVGLGKFTAPLGAIVGAVFNNPSTVQLGAGALGGMAAVGSTGADTSASSIEWTVATSTLPGSGTLYLGLTGGTPVNAGFTSLTFEVLKQGHVAITETFASVAAANTYFSDDLSSLGIWSSGVTGNLDVKVLVSETNTGAGNGYGIELTLGIAPSPAFISPHDASVGGLREGGPAEIAAAIKSVGSDWIAPASVVPSAPSALAWAGANRLGGSLAESVSGGVPADLHIAAGVSARVIATTADPGWGHAVERI
jgi:hypothetical protein